MIFLIAMIRVTFMVAMVMDRTLILLNFLNGLIFLPFLEVSILNFGDFKMRNWCCSCQQYRAWSDCTDEQAGLAGSVLMAKVNHCQFQQGEGLHYMLSFHFILYYITILPFTAYSTIILAGGNITYIIIFTYRCFSV